MVCFVFGFLAGLGVPVTLMVLGWRRVVPHLRESPDAGKAWLDHVLSPLFGKKPE